jgi:hypothetical protein
MRPHQRTEAVKMEKVEDEVLAEDAPQMTTT